MTGARAITGTCVATTVAVAEQTGQICEPEGLAVRSVQKWNLRAHKDKREGDGQDGKVSGFSLHLYNKTKLRQKGLRGQGDTPRRVPFETFLPTNLVTRPSKVVR